MASYSVSLGLLPERSCQDSELTKKQQNERNPTTKVQRARKFAQRRTNLARVKEHSNGKTLVLCAAFVIFVSLWLIVVDSVIKQARIFLQSTTKRIIL